MSTQNTHEDFGEPWETSDKSLYHREGPLCSDTITAEKAPYIAACAGRAEAGWRATKAAIELLMLLHREMIPTSCATKEMQASILAAWPRELLTPP